MNPRTARNTHEPATVRPYAASAPTGSRARHGLARLAACVAAALTVAGTGPATALDTDRIEDAEVRACVERTVPDYTLFQRMNVHSFDANGPVRDSEGTLSWKRFPDSRAKLVATIEAPRERAGTAALLVEREGKQPDIFMYMPERRQVRRVGARTLGTSMLGTDLSYEDFTHFQRMADTGEARRLDDADIGEHPAYVLESFPDDDDSGYSRIVTFVDQEFCLPVRTEFYALNGKLHKELVVQRSEIRRVSDRWVPFRAKMIDHRRQRYTELVTADVRIDPGIRDSAFTPAALRQGR